MPNELLGNVTTNFLEWLAKIVTTKLVVYFGDKHPGDFILPVGDKTSVLRHVCRSNFNNEDQSVCNDLARVFIYLMLDFKLALCK